MPAKTTDSGAIELRPLQDEEIEVQVIGLTPIIPHRWSEKAKALMPGHPNAETGRMTKKGVRKPEEEAEACVYRLEDGRPGMPATAFKAAMVSACRFFERPSMVEAKLLLHIKGEGEEQLVAFEGDPHLREDTPRNANGSADLRYRYSFYPWSARLVIRFTPSSISPASVIALVDAAGRVGVGDWRPGAPKSATGTFGTFRVRVEEEEVAS